MIQDTMGRKRPLGITIIAIVLVIGGIFSIIGGIVSLALSGVAAVIALVIGILDLVLAWGLWRLQPWAFWVTVVLEVIAVINGIVAMVQHNVAGGIISILIAAIILIYLFADRNVRAAFRT